ncbi:MAG TPA: hypothetical protein VFC00_04080 [Micromonosporaceae bacterium]|nr:hypothetical protein [Micromonosporaceae bacterium]
MTATVGAAALADYVTDQMRHADSMLETHAADGWGLCRCGRLYPCRERTHWQRMRDHFNRRRP